MTVLMNLRAPETLKDAFAETCRNQYSTMTAEVNRFMREYVKTYRDAATEYGKRKVSRNSYVGTQRNQYPTGGYVQNPETATWEPVEEGGW